MSTNPSADEQPKQVVAKKVVAAKRKYFFPNQGREVEATSLDEAVSLINAKQAEQPKEGDA